MKIQAAILLSALATSTAFAPNNGSSSSSSSSSSTQLRAEIGETGIAFENVAREWRCKV
jgi:exo-beta-1,3-glucanase (GH17 family)